MTAIEWSCLIINPQILGQCWVPPHVNIMHYARTCKLHLCSKIVQPIVASLSVPWVKSHVKIANCREAWGLTTSRRWLNLWNLKLLSLHGVWIFFAFANCTNYWPIVMCIKSWCNETGSCWLHLCFQNFQTQLLAF